MKANRAGYGEIEMAENFVGVCNGLLFIVSTINSPSAVINQLKNRLNTGLNDQMDYKLATLAGNRLASYICYLHKGGN
jgi:hypothetical protein